MQIKSVKMKNGFFLMFQGSLYAKNLVPRSKGVLCSSLTDRHTDRHTRKWMQRTSFQGPGIFPTTKSRIGPTYTYIHSACSTPSYRCKLSHQYSIIISVCVENIAVVKYFQMVVNNLKHFNSLLRSGTPFFSVEVLLVPPDVVLFPPPNDIVRTVVSTARDTLFRLVLTNVNTFSFK